MECANEEVPDLRVRVFKWNEELHNVQASQGLFMFRIPSQENWDLAVFELVYLLNRDSTESLVSQAIEGKESFSDDTITKLRKSVSEYLLSCFQFDIQMQPTLKKPIIVVAVDVHTSKTTNSTQKRVLSSSVYSSQNKVIHDGVSDNSDSVKRRKVGDARVYKKELRSRMQMKKSNQEEVEIRALLRSRLDEPPAIWITPIVNHEPKGLHRWRLR